MEEVNIMLYLGAIALGALHAFEPGHGKTMIAAYMIGTRGRPIDGLLLGLVATFTHTFSVIGLGILATILSRSFSEEQLHAWLGLFSSLLILTVGIWMLKRQLAGTSHHHHFFCKGHSHDHDHHHDHHEHSHDDHDHHAHDSHHHHAPAAAKPDRHNLINLLLLGISGGLIPCPAGIATLLAAIAAGRIAQGLVVTVFFSLGLGLVMMTIGVTVALAGDKISARFQAKPEFSRRMGIASAIIIILLGCATLYHSLSL